MKKLHFLVAAMTALGAHAAMAQAPVGATSNGAVSTTQPTGKSSKNAARQATAENTPQCVHIITECKSLGFVAGKEAADKGLWKDCFDPVVSGKDSLTQKGKPITATVNASDVQACHKALVASDKKG